MKNTFELLKDLTSIPAVSGSEKNLNFYLTDLLSAYGNVTTDNMNNVFCTFGEGYHFLLDAHIDEIGFVVTEITDDGFIKFDKVGGIDTKMLPAFEVSIWGSKKIDGIISTLPPHLQNADDEKNAPDLNDLAIDTGLTVKELKTDVALGDKITLKRNFTPLINDRISASCLDDRSGVCAILSALDEIKALPCKITVMLSSQEEVGTRGAKIGPFSKNVDEAISVDVSFAYTPECEKNECGEISKGAMIGYSPILDRSISDKLADIAEKNHIAYQKEIMPGKTGTDADVISVCESGIKTALISIPEKYMHQNTEVVDINDIKAVANLIAAYITERSREINA